MIARRAERPLTLPRIYAILDGEAIRSAGLDLRAAAITLRDGGIRLLQYRDKSASETDILRNAGEIGSVFEESGARLLLNDFPHLVAEAGWDGVHVGQADGSVAEARRQVGPDRLVGVSTHTVAQLHRAAATDADYIAYGPIFPTGSKVDAETPVGLPGLRGVRRLDSRPLVAIGGISCERMSDVFGAGADCVALIGALYRGPATLLDNVSQILETAALAGRFTDGRREHSH